MRGNSVKAKLANGGRSIGTMVFEFFTPGIAQLAKNAGAEFILYDMEHAGIHVDTIKQQLSYCRGIDIVPMVRVPTTQYHFVSRILDLGAMGIMVPMVETKEQAEQIVSFTRYPPQGYRGAGFSTSHDDYSGGSVKDKIKEIHERTFVICLIETAKGLENVDAIAAVPNVDCVWLGHFDLTNFMGIPAEFDNPKYLDAVKKIVAAARKHNKAAGFMPVDEKWASDYIAHGFSIFAYGMDSGLFQAALSKGIAHMRDTMGGKN